MTEAQLKVLLEYIEKQKERNDKAYRDAFYENAEISQYHLGKWSAFCDVTDFINSLRNE